MLRASLFVLLSKSVDSECLQAEYQIQLQRFSPCFCMCGSKGYLVYYKLTMDDLCLAMDFSGRGAGCGWGGGAEGTKYLKNSIKRQFISVGHFRDESSQNEWKQFHHEPQASICHVNHSFTNAKIFFSSPTFPSQSTSITRISFNPVMSIDFSLWLLPPAVISLPFLQI